MLYPEITLTVPNIPNHEYFFTQKVTITQLPLSFLKKKFASPCLPQSETNPFSLAFACKVK